MSAQGLINQGDIAGAEAQVKDDIRQDPAEAKHRVFYFQLLCVQGEWEKALTQLNVVGDLDPLSLPMVQTYRELIACEALRQAVFAGTKTPMLFGEPQEWVGLMVEALIISGQGNAAAAAEMRGRAMDMAPATAGTVDAVPFEWMADADSRIGPVLEAVLNGKYYWIPLDRLTSIQFEKPADLRDLVWTPVELSFANGGESVGFVPTRYPGTETQDDPKLRLARMTTWEEDAAGAYLGLGQRLFATDVDEYPMLPINLIRFGSTAEGADEDTGSAEPDASD